MRNKLESGSVENKDLSLGNPFDYKHHNQILCMKFASQLQGFVIVKFLLLTQKPKNKTLSLM